MFAQQYANFWSAPVGIIAGGEILFNIRNGLRCCLITRQYNDVVSWADMYASSEMDVKKMIVSQLISEVRVSKDYKIEIDFKISERQLGLEQGQEIKTKPKKSKGQSELAI